MSDTTELYPVFGAYLEQFIWHDGDNEGGFGYIPPSEQSVSEPATPAKELVKSPRKLKRAIPDDYKENVSPCSLWKKAKRLDDHAYEAVKSSNGPPNIRAWSSKDWNRLLNDAKDDKSSMHNTATHPDDGSDKEEGTSYDSDVGGDAEELPLSPASKQHGVRDSATNVVDQADDFVGGDQSEFDSPPATIVTQQAEEVQGNAEDAGDCADDSSDVTGEGKDLTYSPMLNIQDVRGSDASDVAGELRVNRDESIPMRSESPQPSTASPHAEAVQQVNVAKPAIVQELLRTAQTHRQRYGGKRYSPRRHVWTGKEPRRLLLPTIESEDEVIEDNGGRRTRSSKRKVTSSHPEPDAAGGQNAGAAKKRTKQKRGNKRASVTAKRDIKDDTQEVEDAAQDRSQGAEASGSASNEHEEQDHTNSNAAQTHRVEAGSNTVTETTRQEIIRDRYIEVITTGPGLYPETELTKLSKHAQKNDDDVKICPLCGETPPMAVFMRHMKAFHGEISYKCKHGGCGEEFTRWDSFKRHKERTGH